MTPVRALVALALLAACTHVPRAEQRSSAAIMREVCSAACPNAVIWRWEKTGSTRMYELVDEGRCADAAPEPQIFTPEGRPMSIRDEATRRALKSGLTGHSMICRTIKVCEEGDCG